MFFLVQCCACDDDLAYFQKGFLAHCGVAYLYINELGGCVWALLYLIAAAVLRSFQAFLMKCRTAWVVGGGLISTRMI